MRDKLYFDRSGHSSQHLALPSQQHLLTAIKIGELESAYLAFTGARQEVTQKRSPNTQLGHTDTVLKPTLRSHSQVPVMRD